MKLLIGVLALASAQVKTEFKNTFEAAQAGDTFSLKRLRRSSKEHSVTASDGWQKTALHYAAEYGHSDVASALISGAADLSATDYKGRSPAMLAAAKGHISVLKTILEKCSKNENCQYDQKDDNGKTALHYAAENGQVQVVGILCHVIPVHAQDNGQKTALMLAAARGHGDTVSKLISSCNAMEDAPVDENGMCAGLHAANKGHEAIFRLLEGKRKALTTEVANEIPSDSRKRHVYHHAVLSGNNNFLQNLLKKKSAGASNPDQYGDTILHYAARSGNRDALVMIMKAFPTMITNKNYQNENALHLTVKLPSVGFAEILEYNQPLSPGHFQCMQYLVKSSAGDTLNTQDDYGYTPTLRAVEWGDATAVKFLLHSYSYTSPTSVGGDSMYHIAIRHNRMNSLSALLSAKLNSEAPSVHEQKFLDDIKNLEKENPLFYAVKDGNYRAVELLLRAGMSTNIFDDYKKSPLIWAVIGQKYDIANLLLHNGANPGAKDRNSGVTCLHYAAGSGDNEMVNLIASWMEKDSKWGLDLLKKTDKNGSTALDTAAYLNKGDIVTNLMARMIKLIPGYEEFKASHDFRGNQFREACKAEDENIKSAALALFTRSCYYAETNHSVGSLEALRNCCSSYIDVSESEFTTDEEVSENVSTDDTNETDESEEFFTADVTLEEAPKEEEGATGEFDFGFKK